MANNCTPSEWALLPVRLSAGLLLTDDGCWEWQGTRTQGYGVVSFLGGQCRAHRIAWFVFHGEVEGDLVLDHLCENKACCNPAHLEPVTRGENTRRGNTIIRQYMERTHCNSGHPFNEENTYTRSGNGSRGCRTCSRIAGAKWRAANVEARKLARRKVPANG